MFKRYLIPGLLVALLGALAFGAVQSSRIGTVKAQKRALEAEYGALLDSTTGKDATIARLEKGIGDALVAAAEAQAKVDAAAVAITNYRGLIVAQAKALQDAERADDGKPDCEALLATDLATVCPARADGLRQRASRVPGQDR